MALNAPSKRFKKKMKNFRQGMTVWRVHGYPISDANYRDWGHDHQSLIRIHGEGNALCFHDGFSWFYVFCERKCDVPTRTSWGWIDWMGGTRKTHTFKSIQSMLGSMGDRYFRTNHQAQLFMNEIAQGKHPALVGVEREFSHQMDKLDDMIESFSDIDDFDDRDY